MQNRRRRIRTASFVAALAEKSIAPSLLDSTGHVRAPRPRYSIGAVRKATDSRTRAVRRGPRGSSFNFRWISI